MSESILQGHHKIFGTIYSSDKPQIVKQGKGDIVPLLEQGDIGVICIVNEWKDELVPTRDPTYQRRRRIQLNAVAIARFQIMEIVNDGIQQQEQPSFIQARVALLQDENPPNDDTDVDGESNSMESEVWERVLAKEKEKGSTSALVDQMVSLLQLDDDDDDATTREESYCCADDQLRCEAFSFAAAKLLLGPSPSPQYMQELLQMTSTQERLKRILEWS